MTISERTLRKWRSDVLHSNIPSEMIMHEGDDTMRRRLERIDKLNKQVLRMTQELLDQHLINKK